MSRKLIIDGNAVYEIDEECMLKKRLDIRGKKEKTSEWEKDADNSDKGIQT